MKNNYFLFFSFCFSLIQFIDKTNLPKEILAGWQSDAGAKSASTNSSPELPHHQPQPVVV